MLLWNDERWPLLSFTIGGSFSNADCAAMIEGWESGLAKDVPFAVLAVSSGEPEGEPEEGARPAYAIWLKANGRRIAARCRGLAYITDEPDEPKVRAAMEQLLGCPIRTYPWAQIADAEAWLAERIASPAAWTSTAI
jgi:hypothetical protein